VGRSDYYGNPCDDAYIDGFHVIYKKWRGTKIITVSVVKSLHGKYDCAMLSAVLDGNTLAVKQYEYSKEYSGMGNGYYAIVDENGEIIRDEWD